MACCDPLLPFNASSTSYPVLSDLDYLSMFDCEVLHALTLAL